MADERHNPYCLPCIYYGKSTMSCDYIFLENARRPCPGGEGCTARRLKKDVNRMGRPKWDTELGMQMWLEGKKDREIAEYFGIASNTVTTCRNKYWEKHRQPPAKKREEPEEETAPEETTAPEQTVEPTESATAPPHKNRQIRNGRRSAWLHRMASTPFWRRQPRPRAASRPSARQTRSSASGIGTVRMICAVPELLSIT